MSLPDRSAATPTESTSPSATQITCLECGRAINRASSQTVCADCAMRNLLHISQQSMVGHPPLPLLSDSRIDVTLDATETLRTVDPLEPEQQLGPFKIIQRLGQGGMGIVYEAQDCLNQRRVALKVLSRPVGSEESRQRFLREGRLAASINHPNSVFVFGTHQIDSLSMISMELVRGGTLESRVRLDGPLTPRDAIEIALQLIDGLVAAHAKGVLHRDIKPSNCFMGEDGTVKIGDFGLSISSDPEFHERITTQGVMLGTPAFSSPEQLRGDTLDVRSDIYAFGSTLYYLLTGKTPFSADGVVKMIAKVLDGAAIEPRQMNREIPVVLSQLVMRCLSKEPGDRFRNYQELRSALLALGVTNIEAATLGQRALAEVIEWLALLVLGVGMWFVITNSAMMFFYHKFLLSSIGAGNMLFWLGVYCTYYATTESLFGCSLGKWLLGLRVVDQSHHRPSYHFTFLRAAIFMLVPTIPYWLYLLYVELRFDDFQIDSPMDSVQMAIGFVASISYWLFVAILFITARKRNGWLGIHEKLSGTRVVQRREPTVPLATTAGQQEHRVTFEQSIGPYSILGRLATRDGSSLLVGFDPVLLRKVWIRYEPDNSKLRTHPEIARPTRLRWLNCVEDQQRSWDVFEFVEGQPLTIAETEGTDWNSARRWLADLHYELSHTIKDNTLPYSLSIDHLWLTHDGRLKLLDFPAPLPMECEGAASAFDAPTQPDRSQSVQTNSDAAPDHSDKQLHGLLRSVAQFLKRSMRATRKRPLPPPLFVTQLLDGLAGHDELSIKLDGLKAAVALSPMSDRRRRLLMSAACYAVPILLTLACLLSEVVNVIHYTVNPEQRQMLILSNIALNNAQSNNVLYSDAMTVMVSKIKNLAQDDPVRQQLDSFVRSTRVIQPRLREDLILAAEAPAPSQGQLEAAMERIEADPSYQHWRSFPSINWFNGLAGPATIGPMTLLLFTAIPALIAGVLFRGGLVIHGFRTVIVKMNGRPAGRVRILMRNLLPAASVTAVCLLWIYVSLQQPDVFAISGLLLLYGLASISNLCGLRSLPDRIVGTAVVSRD